jgi:hypothetical protein
MVSSYFAVVILAFIVLVAAKRMLRRSRPSGSRRSFRPGPGAAGTIYDLLNEDRRHAVEIIVEDKAAYTDPEHADGNLPDLEKP